MPPQPKALLITTTTTVVAPGYTTVALLLRSPRLAPLAMGLDRWPSGSLVHTADELHLTLCYLGEMADLASRESALAAAVAAMAADLPPVAGSVSGIGRFTGQEGMDAVHVTIDSPDLAAWLIRLQEGLAAAGFPCDRQHGHDPHITLAYVPSEQALDLPPPWPLEIWFDALTLGWGTTYRDYPLAGEPFAPPADVTEAAQAGAAAAADEPADGTAGDGVASIAPATADPDPPALIARAAPAIWRARDYQPRQLKRQNDPASRTWKTTPHHVKDIDGRTVVGIFSVFGNVDSYGDVCMPGSFTKTFRERAGQIHHIWQHDVQQPPIAVITRLQEVGRDALPAAVATAYPEASGGAEVTRTYLERAPLAEWVLEAIAKGAPLQMSYMYDPLRYEHVTQDDEGTAIRLLYEQRLWETSDVLWGANAATRASKALDALPPLPLDVLLGQMEASLIRAQKAGARNAAEDLARINTIHHLTVQLGCTVCTGMVDEATDPKAAPRRPGGTHAPAGPSLADLEAALDYLTFITQE